MHWSNVVTCEHASRRSSRITLLLQIDEGRKDLAHAGYSTKAQAPRRGRQQHYGENKAHELAADLRLEPASLAGPSWDRSGGGPPSRRAVVKVTETP